MGGRPGARSHLCPPLSAQTLDARPTYTEEELQRFEAELRDKEEELRRKVENLRQEQELLKERGKALEAQRREYQQVSVCTPRPHPAPAPPLTRL